MKKYRHLLILTGIVTSLFGFVFQNGLGAQASLSMGGNNPNFGSRTLTGGFMNDPFTVSVRSGGRLNVGEMGLGVGCVGYATSQPDFILQYRNAESFLRFFFQGSGDASLIITDASGRWYCDDDTAGPHPQVDINNPPSGQFDIWIGSSRPGETVRGTLSITELRGVSVRN